MPRTKPPAKAKPAPKKAGAARKMPPPMPRGETLIDFSKKSTWTLGTSIGKGGFGEIYSATKQGERGEYVVKIEPYENGPLFTELSFYRRVAKPSMIADWCALRKLSYLSVPEFIAAGEHTLKGVRYRFMVMQRYGEDIEKKFTQNSRQFGLKTVCYLALRLLGALEFLHESEFVHADVKGSNLLTGWTQPHQVYLVDYGLAHRYSPEGATQEYREDPRRRHDGTIEFTSIDAHNGANPSRRSDLEIMGYCLLQWAAGALPWEGNLDDKDYVAREKMKYKSNVSQLMKACFTGATAPSCLKDFMKTVYKLEYTEQPDYNGLRKLFLNGLKGIGCKDDAKDLDWLKQKASGSKTSPFKRGRPPVARRAKVELPEEECDGGASAKPATKKRKAPAAKPKQASDSEDSDNEFVKPKPSSSRRRKAVNYKEESSDDEISSKRPIGAKRSKKLHSDDSVADQAISRSRIRKRKGSPIGSDDDLEGDSVAKKVPKRATIRKPVSKLIRDSPVDIVPEVTYPTELGYKGSRNGLRAKTIEQRSPPKQSTRAKK